MSTPGQQPAAGNLAYVEALYADYLRDAQAVGPEWQTYFSSWQGAVGPSGSPGSLFHGAGTSRQDVGIAVLQQRVDQLIRNYRVRGHIIACLDPLGQPRDVPPELDPRYYGFTEADMERAVSLDSLGGGRVCSLREVLLLLHNTYCRFIGAQFMHIDDHSVRKWLQDRMESSENHIRLSRQTQLRILTRLTDAVIFEQFIQKKYLGAKTFSLEGAESLIPLLDLSIEKAAEQGVVEIVLGMAHRGRLNVLANVMGKSAQQIFREFEDADPALHLGGRGDVKYHLGYNGEWTAATGRRVALSLCFNPSHLEFVNPVALGRMRAKQDRSGDVRGERGLVVLIHGDAAFAGEGVVQETLNLSELPGYTTGGTLHVVVNNQIGFTTSPAEGRSSTYATAVAKMLHIPIFHVNGEDPEAVAQVVDIALDYRAKYRKDVVIDMYCYRRRGHNEGDEPQFTQPLMYRAIEQRPSVRDAYLERLLKLGGVAPEEAARIADERKASLEQELTIARREDYQYRHVGVSAVWAGYAGGPESDAVDVTTAVSPERARQTLEQLTQLPPGFRAHPKIAKFLEARREMAAGKRPLDWSGGESLALATLAAEGVRIRLSGQDSQRGTFSHRHGVFHDFETGQSFCPFQNLGKNQGAVELINSPLSEIGVLGFDYGYSLDCPDGLVMWEAQFGDFANVAQVIFDQFLCSAEDKWNRLSGLVVLLPHGFEGQGPEHSSARPERFLSLCAGDNMQVAYPSTPAQLFHLLRRQVLRKWRKPLVVMTPKSMLRNPLVVSALADFSQGEFHRVIADTPLGESPAGPRPSNGNGDHPARPDVKRILLCTGKIYYELDKARSEQKRGDVAIVRVEQLYPLPTDALRQALAGFADDTPAVWVQEEPENMGAWRFLRILYGERLLGRFPWTCVSRPAAASPATGSGASHRIEQERVVSGAFGPLGSESGEGGGTERGVAPRGSPALQSRERKRAIRSEPRA